MLCHTPLWTIYTAPVPTVSSQIQAGWPYAALHISFPHFSESDPSPLSLCALVLRHKLESTLHLALIIHPHPLLAAGHLLG